MRVVWFLAAMVAVWVQPANAAVNYDFTISGYLTGTDFVYDHCGPGFPTNCMTTQPASMSFQIFVSLPVSAFADGSEIFGYGNGNALGQYQGTILSLGNGDFTGINLDFQHYGLPPACGVCSGTDTFLHADTFTVRAAGALPEPATWSMMLLGFLVIGAGMRRPRLHAHALASL